MAWQSALDSVRSRTEDLVASARRAAGSQGLPFGGGTGNQGLGTSDGDASGDLLKHNRGWVYSCCRLFAQRIAGQSLHVAKRTARPQRTLTPGQRKDAPAHVKAQAATLEPIEGHPLSELFANPNEFMTGWQLAYVTIVALELCGRAYWWIRQSRGEGGVHLQLWPLPPSWVTPLHSETDLFAKWKVNPAGSMGEGFELPGEEVVYFNYPSVTNPIGSYSTLEAQQRAVSADEAITEAQYRIFQNGVFPRHAIILGKQQGIDEGEGRRPRLHDHQYQQLIELVRKRYRGVTRFDEPIILDGLVEDVKRINNTALEMDFLNSGIFTKARILQSYGVNEISLGAVENANRASAAIADRHLCNEINSKLAMLSHAVTQWVGPMFDGGAGSLLCWFEPVKPNDPEFELDEWKFLASVGAVSRNELRAGVKGLPPIIGGDSIGVPFSQMDVPILVEGQATDGLTLIGQVEEEVPDEAEGAGEADAEETDVEEEEIEEDGKGGKRFRRRRVRVKGASPAFNARFNRRFYQVWLRQHGASERALKRDLSEFFCRTVGVDLEGAGDAVRKGLPAPGR